jgi:hypothetical protein
MRVGLPVQQVTLSERVTLSENADLDQLAGHVDTQPAVPTREPHHPAVSVAVPEANVSQLPASPLTTPADSTEDRPTHVPELPQYQLEAPPPERSPNEGQPLPASGLEDQSEGSEPDERLDQQPVERQPLEERVPVQAIEAPLELPNKPKTPEEGTPTLEPDGSTAPPPPQPPEQTTPPTPVPQGAPPVTPSGVGELLELTADRQEYDTIRRVFFAEGNVLMQFRGSVLTADRLRVNLLNRTAVAEGNVALAQGQQVLRGNRFNYNFVQEQGTVFNARGEIFIPEASSGFAPALPTDVTAGVTDIPLSDRIVSQQPVSAVSSTGGLTFTLGGGNPDATETAVGFAGTINRLRFEADQIDFVGDNWEATNVRLTNDPFSPPELELRSRHVTFTRLSPTRSEIRARNPRAVVDRGFSLPLFRERVIIDRRERDPGLFRIGFDDEDRGGFFIERTFDVLTTPTVQLSVRPQLLVQRAFDNGNFFTASSYGLGVDLEITPDLLTTIQGTAVFTSLDPDDFEEQLRASLRAQRRLGRGYALSLEYSYRDRLFNGSLGYQNVQTSLGFLFTSPSLTLGTSGISFSYQAGAQYINANTDRDELLPPPEERDNSRASLGRFQVSAALNRGFLLWYRPPLPATPTEGLRYTPNPLVPYISAYAGLTGVVSYYTNDEVQATLTGTVGLSGQFGHFSRPFLDYTAFNLAFSQTLKVGESPFFFDRVNDTQVLSFGLVQQVYGPIRIGFQSSLNLDRDEEIDTEYILEYSRRTFSVGIRVNPEREVASFNLRINDFNWTGTPEPFSGLGTGSVQVGVER